MNKKVSVVVTCYNHEKYIEECLRSIFAQTHQNIELIIFNDGSTDLSDEVISSTLLDSPFVETSYFSGKNRGLAFVKNDALSKITGEFLLFIDSDNFINPNHIEKLLVTLLENQADIAYCQLWDFISKKDLLRKDLEYEFSKELEGNMIDASSLVRVDTIGNIKFDENLNNKVLEDYDFWLSLIINNSAKPIFVPDTKLNYRVLDESISKRGNWDNYYNSYLYILDKYKNYISNEKNKAIKNNILMWINNYEKSEKLSKERFQLIKNYEKLESERLELIKSQEKTIQEEFKVKELMNQELLDREQKLIEIKNSASYKLGNLQIRTAKKTIYVLKHPKLLLKIPGKIVDFFTKIHLFTKIKKAVLAKIRNNLRAKNNYINPNRVLVYVIYANNEKLHDYKIIFLKALAKLSEKTIIVVNGELIPEDQVLLSSYGQLELRENKGYDTAAFRHGILTLGKEELGKYDELLLVNDTNVGPFTDLEKTFRKMAERKVDFWGISYGEPQNDFTGYNKYGQIPVHLQSYFLVIEKSLSNYSGFFRYWENLEDTNSRNKAIGKHETVFTKHFEDLGFKHDAVSGNNDDSAMYIHPLTMLKQFDVPLIKYTAFANYNNDKFAWQGLQRKTEVPELLEYIKNETDYPITIIDSIMNEVKNKKVKEHILIIDGVENAIPQCTRYRSLNKAEQLRSFGYDVWVINNSDFQMGYAEYASHIIIYRAPYSDKLAELCRLAKKYNKPVYYDIDDLVIDTKYTNLLDYTQQLSEREKIQYDSGVENYKKMLLLCDSAITTTNRLCKELQNYQEKVILNRNLASQELVEISSKNIKDYNKTTDKIKIAYFSGSITHNENFDLIKPAIVAVLSKYKNVELHLVGHLNIPRELNQFKQQIVANDYVDWKELPALISQMDINLAPLVDTIFNQAKSEIKWLEAALVAVPTIASNVGGFSEMIEDNKTGVLVGKNQWFEKLESLILQPEKRQRIAISAYEYVLKNCMTLKSDDEMIREIEVIANGESL